MAADPNSTQTTEFLRLFSESSRHIYWLIRTAVVRQDIADEVFQEASATLWQKFNDFQPGTNFTGWAMQVARIEVLRFQQRRARDQKVFGTAFVERVLGEVEQSASAMDYRRDLLADCFALLSFPDRELVNQRYKPGTTSRQLAQAMGRSEGYVSKALSRIHRLLFECISRRESETGVPR